MPFETAFDVTGGWYFDCVFHLSFVLVSGCAIRLS